MGTCIEGIRVDSHAPGFDGEPPIIAIANATGPNAPKTNVARSTVETTSDDTLLRTVYSIYCEHIRKEIEELSSRRRFSKTWATREARYLLSPLFNEDSASRNSRPTNLQLLVDEVKEIPMFLVEHHGQRHAITPARLQQEDYFWTIASAFLGFAENLIGEAAGESSLSKVIDALNMTSFRLPSEPILCGYGYYGSFEELATAGKEVDAIMIKRDQRRIDLRWAHKGEPPRWRAVPAAADEPAYMSSRARSRASMLGIGGRSRWMLGQHGVELLGETEFGAIRAFGVTYILHTNPLAAYLTSWLTKYGEDADETAEALAFLLTLVDDLLGSRTVSETLPRDKFAQYCQYIMERAGPRMRTNVLGGVVDSSELFETIQDSNWRVFDLAVWERRRSD